MTGLRHITVSEAAPRWRNVAVILRSLATCLRNREALAYLATMSTVPADIAFRPRDV